MDDYDGETLVPRIKDCRVVNPSYSQCKASSVYSDNAIGECHGTGRLNSGQAWSAKHNRADEWWQMDLGSVQVVSGVVTQGRADGYHQYVKSYQVLISEDEYSWTDVEGKTYAANRDANNEQAVTIFASAVKARYVRIVVKTWEGHISMRAAVLMSEDSLADMNRMEIDIGEALACDIEHVASDFMLRYHFQANICDLSGKEFSLEVLTGQTVLEIKQVLAQNPDYQDKDSRIVLSLGAEELPDKAILSDTSAVEGDMLTLTMAPCLGVVELIVSSISDQVQWHRKHKFALESEPLTSEIEKIEVTVKSWSDQGWGGKQARLFIELHGVDGALITECKLFGPLRTNEYDDAKFGSSPYRTLNQDEKVVAMAQPGMTYQLRYQVGGGGGHSIKVDGWVCKIYPFGWSAEAPRTSVKTNVDLPNPGAQVGRTARSGVHIGKWSANGECT